VANTGSRSMHAWNQIEYGDLLCGHFTLEDPFRIHKGPSVRASAARPYVRSSVSPIGGLVARFANRTSMLA
jgi:hypothetical protein